MFHYTVINSNSNVLGNFEGEGNVEFLKSKNMFKLFGKENIFKIKNELLTHDVPLRV